MERIAETRPAPARRGRAGASDSPSRKAARERFIPLLRSLVRAHQAFTVCDEKDVRKLGLTLPQYDVIATLGNTQGMTFKELGQRTLITKGTLTGVIDRLEAKGFVKRVAAQDRRSTVAVLTSKGSILFESTFPAHVAYLKKRFACLSDREMNSLQRCLDRLTGLFSDPREGGWE